MSHLGSFSLSFSLSFYPSNTHKQRTDGRRKPDGGIAGSGPAIPPSTRHTGSMNDYENDVNYMCWSLQTPDLIVLIALIEFRDV